MFQLNPALQIILYYNEYLHINCHQHWFGYRLTLTTKTRLTPLYNSLPTRNHETRQNYTVYTSVIDNSCRKTSKFSNTTCWYSFHTPRPPTASYCWFSSEKFCIVPYFWHYTCLVSVYISWVHGINDNNSDAILLATHENNYLRMVKLILSSMYTYQITNQRKFRMRSLLTYNDFNGNCTSEYLVA